MKSAPNPAPTTTAPQPNPASAFLPVFEQNPPVVQEGVELASATPATPRPKSATDNVASTVSATGAARDVVHSGGGCSSVWGHLVEIREHPGVATTKSVASEMRCRPPNVKATVPCRR
jgi:hypothetical protein